MVHSGRVLFTGTFFTGTFFTQQEIRPRSLISFKSSLLPEVCRKKFIPTPHSFQQFNNNGFRSRLRRPVRKSPTGIAAFGEVHFSPTCFCVRSLRCA